VKKAVPQAEVVNEAVRYAAMIAANSPDAVMYMGWFEARIEDRGSRAGSGDHVGAGICRIAEKWEYIRGIESVCRKEVAKMGGR
jgi:hypothetical protein